MADTFALVGGRLIDGSGGDALDDGCVVIRDRTIAWTGPAAAASIPASTAIIDTRGLTLMPGLIDGHVHLLSYAGEGRRDIHLWNVLTFIEEQTLHAAANARTALRSGVTTVRDMAGSRPEIAVKHAIDEFVIEGARVVCSGFVGMTAGHGDMFCPANIERRLWEPVDGPDACRRLVRRYARDGSDLIKICTSGGVLSIGDRSEWRNFTDEETRAIVDEAHALGMRVAAHAHTRSGIRQALEAGVDTLEHGSDLDDELIELMLERGVRLCPTLAITEFILTQGAARGVPAESLEKARRLRERRAESVRAAYAAGVPIFMGTDSCNTFAFGRHAWELELMCAIIGMSPAESIAAATSVAADAIGLGGWTGRLEAGYRADLLVVAGDPLADITLVQRQEHIVGVIRDGRVLVDNGLLARTAVPDLR